MKKYLVLLLLLSQAAFATYSGDPPGPTGETGATGATGVTGPTGNDGLIGSTGPTGIGSDGAVGATGATGKTGATGATGNDGSNGSNGAIGATGATGQTGSAGTNGSDGAIGATGATGKTGATGNDGVAGANGADGAVGATGQTGQTGRTGPTGNDGAAGANGSNGAVGATGQTGPTGNDGAIGATGQTGRTGPTGNDGTNGTNGAVGATGQTGPTGNSAVDFLQDAATLATRSKINFQGALVGSDDVANSRINLGINQSLLTLSSIGGSVTDAQVPDTLTIGNGSTIAVKDANLSIQDDGDTTKVAKFQTSGISTGTTRTYTVPDVSGTLFVGDQSQTVTSAFFNANGIQWFDNTDSSKRLKFDLSTSVTGKTVTIKPSAFASGNTSITLPNSSGQLALTTDSAPMPHWENFNLQTADTGATLAMSPPLGEGGEAIYLDFTEITDIGFGLYTIKFPRPSDPSSEILYNDNTANVTNKTFTQGVKMSEIATPSTPASGFGQMYFGTDSHPYAINDGGVALPLMQGRSATEIDFGSTPLTEKSFTITDAHVTASSVIIARITRATSTGKSYIDESEMDVLDVIVTPAAGSFTAFVRSLQGQVRGTFKMTYTIGG